MARRKRDHELSRQRQKEAQQRWNRLALLGWLEENVVTSEVLADMPYWHYIATAHWARLREAALARDGACANCGATEDLKAVHVPHFDWSRRGRETADDLRCLCATCGKAAHDETEEESHAPAS